MMPLRYITIILLLLSLSCDRVVPDAQSIVDRSIKAHGGELYENSIVEFDFRGRHYKFERNRGIFEYHRIFHDSAGVFHDVLDNSGFKRFLNEKEVSLDRDWVRRYSNSVNSVAYFSYLPFGLNDPAVNKKLIGEEEIEGNKYHKIRVTFAQEGGGEDFEDVFVYWINQENYQMDYLGYSYITDGGGIRFRKAINRRIENGLMYSDFINYRGASDFKDVPRLASLYKEGKLEVLSEISIENLEVKRFN